MAADRESQPGSAVATVLRGLDLIKSFEHRLELVSQIEGVTFYNDSKATSVDATLKALEAFCDVHDEASDEDGKVVLILGGRGKKAPYAPLASLVRDNVRKLILIGEDADTIAAELGEYAPYDRARDMKDAVELSFQAGDVITIDVA